MKKEKRNRKKKKGKEEKGGNQEIYLQLSNLPILKISTSWTQPTQPCVSWNNTLSCCNLTFVNADISLTISLLALLGKIKINLYNKKKEKKRKKKERKEKGRKKEEIKEIKTLKIIKSTLLLFCLFFC